MEDKSFLPRALLEFLRDPCAGLFDDSSLDPGKTTPLAATLTAPFRLSSPLSVGIAWSLRARIRWIRTSMLCPALRMSIVPIQRSVLHSATTCHCGLENFSGLGLALAFVPHKLQGAQVKLSKGFTWSPLYYLTNMRRHRHQNTKQKPNNTKC